MTAQAGCQLIGRRRIVEITGSGSAELDDDGTVEIEISFHNGDAAVLKAYRE